MSVNRYGSSSYFKKVSEPTGVLFRWLIALCLFTPRMLLKLSREDLRAEDGFDLRILESWPDLFCSLLASIAYLSDPV